VTMHLPLTLVLPPFRLDTANQQLWHESHLLPLLPSSDALYIACIDLARKQLHEENIL